MSSKNSNLSTQATDLPPSPTDAALRNLGQRIAQARKRQGWTQARLAEHIGAHIRTIRRMEAGAPGTAIGHIVQVLQAFGELEMLELLLADPQKPPAETLPQVPTTQRQDADKPPEAPATATKALPQQEAQRNLQHEPPTKHTTLQLHFGDKKHLLGHLDLFRQGPRLSSHFQYDPQWLARPNALPISPDLPWQPGIHSLAPYANGSPGLFGALLDTAPGPWARKVIRLTHEAVQPIHPGLAPLDELQYLSAVPDASRLGALRLPDAGLTWWGRQPRPSNNPAKLSVAVDAAWALETGRASPDHLSALMNRGCFLGGSRPKLTYVLDNGNLALVKLPRPSDAYSVPGAEVLALELARHAGIPSAQAQLWIMALVPIAVITRFDRTSGKERLPYVSAATLLNAHGGETRSYVELLEAMASFCGDFKADAQQLWRRLVFNALITHVDDHWRGMGFLHTPAKGWHLAPAFGLSPTPQPPQQAYRSHTPLSAELGPLTSVTMLMRHAHLFALDAQQAKGILRQVVGVTTRWHRWADSRWPLGKDRDLLRPAFEHERLREALGILG